MFLSTFRSVQAPGGARIGGVEAASFSSLSETTTRETESVVRTLPKQAGGPAGGRRALIARSRSLSNGKTVACRGAGRSGRQTFPDLMMVIATSERRMPGGIRGSGGLLCS
jgi:hypothetical protein